jgi:hypothetical protein
MRNTLAGIAVGVVTLAGLGVASAQAPPPQPGPEHEKLGSFVGTWASEGTMSPSPFGPGGRMTSVDTCEWFEGRFAVVCRYEGKGPMGPMKGLGIMGYSADQKVYTYYGLDNSPMTMTSVARGTLHGDTWSYTDESTFGGQKVTSRYTMQFALPDAYSFRWEMQGPDGRWTTVAEGKATKGRTSAPK